MASALFRIDSDGALVMKKKPASGKRVSRLRKDLVFYGDLLVDIKSRIRLAQTRAAQAANAELVRLYWDIGCLIDQRQRHEGWGAGVIPRLARDLHNELPDLKGFSERNIMRMLAFYREYPSADPKVTQPAALLPATKTHTVSIVPQAASQLPMTEPLHQLVSQIPWYHHVILIQKVKDLPTRLWYMQQTLAQGWSRNVLAAMIAKKAHTRQGGAVSNFTERLPTPQSDLARELLKDPYIFDFLTLEEPFRERELETGLIRHLEKFLLELGRGFAFVGRQYPLAVGGDDFFLDLLFYHLHLRCFVVIDLKTGPFIPEYAGKMNFYCSSVDAQLRHKDDQPTIGLILCQTKNRVIAEYALRDINKPMGVADYELTRALPTELASSLPSIEQLEAELQTELESE